MSVTSANRNTTPAQTAIGRQPEKPFDLKPRPGAVRRQGRVTTTAEYLSRLRSTEENVPKFGKIIASFSKFLRETGKPMVQSPHGSLIDARDGIIQIKDKAQPHLVVSYNPKDGETRFWDISSGEPKQLKGEEAGRAIEVLKNAALHVAIDPDDWKPVSSS
jgi:hypothetical protein